jgi:hypothetical protein
MLCNFYGKVIIEPTTIEHTNGHSGKSGSHSRAAGNRGGRVAGHAGRFSPAVSPAGGSGRADPRARAGSRTAVDAWRATRRASLPPVNIAPNLSPELDRAFLGNDPSPSAVPPYPIYARSPATRVGHHFIFGTPEHARTRLSTNTGRSRTREL